MTHGYSALPATNETPDMRPGGEPTVWVLTETLEKRQTTTNGYLWFSDPVNSGWTALYAHPAPAEPPMDEGEWLKKLALLIHMHEVAPTLALRVETMANIGRHARRRVAVDRDAVIEECAKAADFPADVYCEDDNAENYKVGRYEAAALVRALKSKP